MGGIGIVRISGPLARAIGVAVAGGPVQPRRARYAQFQDLDGQPVDAGICLYFAAPHSFTGEDVIELQGHGGPVVMRLVLEAVLARGARMARPGEFTERAFLNGKIDLAQAEAVADLIASASAAAARGALRSLEGAFSTAVSGIDSAILGLRVFVEAAMDFPDEAIEFLAEGQIAARLQAVREQIASLLHETQQGVLLRDGIVVALVGAPNVGKSSLLNRLSGQERAIVSDIPGTTRDPVEADLVLDGLPVRIVDTAGLRQSGDLIEQEGVRRTTLHATRADVVLALEEDATATSWDRSGLRLLLRETLPDVAPERVIRILNKVDLSARSPGVCTLDARPAEIAANPLAEPATVRISATSGAGVPALIELITAQAGYAAHEGTFTARRRHVDALCSAGAAIAESLRLLNDHASPELVAEELRSAHRCLGGIVGTVSADDLLGEIFANFCIGK
jgi:tRNA modification GTPase